MIPLAQRTDEYVPVGYLTGDDERARHVDFVTLNGVRIEPDDLCASDDVAGWVNTSQPAADGIDVLMHRRGTVRIHWKPL